MRLICVSILGCMLTLAMFGCRTEVKKTNDSTKVEVDLPKVEVGNAPVDLDPRTDKDIDVDTPLPGDK